MTIAHTNNKSSATENSSMDFISQMVATGLSNGFESLKEKVSSSIKENGDEYLSDALEKLKKSASSLTEWSKKNPVKTAVAIAAVLAVTAILVSTEKNRNAVTTKTAKPGPTLSKSVTSMSARKSRVKTA